MARVLDRRGEVEREGGGNRLIGKNWQVGGGQVIARQWMVPGESLMLESGDFEVGGNTWMNAGRREKRMMKRFGWKIALIVVRDRCSAWPSCGRPSRS